MKTVHTISKAAALAALLLLTTLHLSAQELDYNTFISRVMQSNLNYAVAKLGVAYSITNLEIALLFGSLLGFLLGKAHIKGLVVREHRIGKPVH